MTGRGQRPFFTLMTRSRFLLLFGASAGAVSASDRTPAEEAEDAEICRFANRLIGASVAADFTKVAKMMHPAALKLFFDTVCTGFEQLAEKYGNDPVLVVSGLTAHPQQLGLNHSSFFVHCLDLLASRYPQAIAIPTERGLKIIGGIVDPQGPCTYAHILYDFRGELKSQTSETKYVQPKNLTLIQTGSGWQCWSAPGAKLALNAWHSELAAKKS